MAPVPPDPSAERRPDPDPTVLTTSAVERAIRGLQKTLDARFEGLERLYVEQLTGLANQIQAQRDYFIAILEEHRHGLEVAEQEREKAARALETATDRTIMEGDRNLRD